MAGRRASSTRHTWDLPCALVLLSLAVGDRLFTSASQTPPPLAPLLLASPGSTAHQSGQTGAPPACGSCHTIPPPTGAHAQHLTTVTAVVACASCHFAEDFATIHLNGQVDVVFDALARPGAARDASGCTVYCHGNGRGRLRPLPWEEKGSACATCHDNEATQGAQLSGRHALHLRLGVGCADCHGAVVARKGTIADPALHINGKVDVRVLGGRYADGSCQPACHEARGW